MIYTINENTNKITEHCVDNINILSKFFRTLPNREATQQEVIVFLNKKVIYDIKKETRRRILTLYSEVEQMNTLMGQDSDNISIMNNSIFTIRAKSDELEVSLDSMTLDQLKAFDPTNNSNWE
jgi:hypothetical protein